MTVGFLKQLVGALDIVNPLIGYKSHNLLKTGILLAGLASKDHGLVPAVL